MRKQLICPIRLCQTHWIRWGDLVKHLEDTHDISAWFRVASLAPVYKPPTGNVHPSLPVSEG